MSRRRIRKMVLKWLDCKRVVQICKPSEEIIPHSHSPTATGVNYRIDSDEEAKKNGEEEYKKVMRILIFKFRKRRSIFEHWAPDY